MGTESIEASFLSIFALTTFFIFLLVSKYSNKISRGVLFDGNFTKPQSFHDHPVAEGGMACIMSLIVFYFYYLLYSKILYEYVFLSFTMFCVGFLDDLKINIKPLIRLLLMIFFYFF